MYENTIFVTCMCCISVNIYIYIFVIYIYIYIYMCAHMNVRHVLYICMHKCDIYIYVYVYVYVYSSVYLCIFVIYIYIITYKYACQCIHTGIHESNKGIGQVTRTLMARAFVCPGPCSSCLSCEPGFKRPCTERRYTCDFMSTKLEPAGQPS